MRIRTGLIGTVATFAACLAISSPVSAAFITINDSEMSTVTITAGDFENGFSINGNLLTSGLGNSASITLTDSLYSFTGSWIDLGQTADGFRGLYFSLPSDPTHVTSGIEYSASTNGTNGFLFNGYIGAYVDPDQYGYTNSPNPLQNGQTGDLSLSSLNVSFISENPNPVPEPGTLALLGIGLAGLAIVRKRAKK